LPGGRSTSRQPAAQRTAEAGILSGMPGWIGFPELIVLLIVVLLVFGPKRLPEMGRSLGRGMREFKDSVTGKDRDEDRHELPVAKDATESTPPRERDTVL
jgi:sec-independent protein translocase protein TatA